MRRMLQASAFVCLALASLPTAAQTKPKLVTEEFMVPAKDPGIELYVRNKRPADMTQFSADRTVIYVHGSTTRPRPPST